MAVYNDDGTIACTPFHARFGKLRLWRAGDKAVRLEVNGEPVHGVHIRLGPAGEIFFLTLAPSSTRGTRPRRRDRAGTEQWSSTSNRSADPLASSDASAAGSAAAPASGGLPASTAATSTSGGGSAMSVLSQASSCEMGSDVTGGGAAAAAAGQHSSGQQPHHLRRDSALSLQAPGDSAVPLAQPSPVLVSWGWGRLPQPRRSGASQAAGAGAMTRGPSAAVLPTRRAQAVAKRRKLLRSNSVDAKEMMVWRAQPASPAAHRAPPALELPGMPPTTQVHSSAVPPRLDLMDESGTPRDVRRAPPKLNRSARSFTVSEGLNELSIHPAPHTHVDSSVKRAEPHGAYTITAHATVDADSTPAVAAQQQQQPDVQPHRGLEQAAAAAEGLVLAGARLVGNAAEHIPGLGDGTPQIDPDDVIDLTQADEVVERRHSTSSLSSHPSASTSRPGSAAGAQDASAAPASSGWFSGWFRRKPASATPGAAPASGAAEPGQAPGARGRARAMSAAEIDDVRSEGGSEPGPPGAHELSPGRSMWSYLTDRNRPDSASGAVGPESDTDDAASVATYESDHSDSSVLDGEEEGEQRAKFLKTLRPTSEQLQCMKLKDGDNLLEFKVYDRAQLLRAEQAGAERPAPVASMSCTLWLWSCHVKIVVSDVDGTITKSDVWGHVTYFLGRGGAWTHEGVAELFSRISANGYKVLYLTSRAIGQVEDTKNYLFGNVSQHEHRVSFSGTAAADVELGLGGLGRATKLQAGLAGVPSRASTSGPSTPARAASMPALSLPDSSRHEPSQLLAAASAHTEGSMASPSEATSQPALLAQAASPADASPAPPDSASAGNASEVSDASSRTVHAAVQAGAHAGPTSVHGDATVQVQVQDAADVAAARAAAERAALDAATDAVHSTEPGQLASRLFQLPPGPVITSPDRLLDAFTREVIRRRPQEFKIAALRDVRALFPSTALPFTAGFGNRPTDTVAYRAVGVMPGRVFIINPSGHIAAQHPGLVGSGARLSMASYAGMMQMVDEVFPPVCDTGGIDAHGLSSSSGAPPALEPAFNEGNFWKRPLPVVDFSDEEDAPTGGSSVPRGAEDKDSVASKPSTAVERPSALGSPAFGPASGPDWAEDRGLVTHDFADDDSFNAMSVASAES